MKSLRKSRMSKAKPFPVALVRRVLLAVFAALLGVSVYLTNAQYVAGNAMPMPFGYGISVVVSGSMEPTIHMNDVVIVKQTDRLEQGDIIVYQSGSYAVIHRLVSIRENGVKLARTDAAIAYGVNPEFIELTTKGDANNAPDEPITLQDVKGRYIGRLRGFGWFINFIRSPAGLVGMILLILLTMRITSAAEKKQETEELAEIEKEIQKLKEENKRL